MIVSSARFSPDRRWRYELRRQWDPSRPYVAFIGLNPSKADEVQSDRTVSRCIDFAKRWDYGGLVMLNVFAVMATDPRDMRRARDPVGPENDVHIRAVAQEVMFVVVAWGNGGRWQNRGATVLDMLGEVRTLGLTKRGFPRHPLYVRGETLPVLLPTDHR